MTDTFPRFLGDVGGTNARFGWQANAQSGIEHVLVLPCAAHETLEAAIRTYLDLKRLPMPRAGALGIANPITGDVVRMTNHHWSFSISEMQRNLGLEQLNVINDFTALLWHCHRFLKTIWFKWAAPSRKRLPPRH